MKAKKRVVVSERDMKREIVRVALGSTLFTR